MFYRRKILLSLIQLFNGELEKIRLQKLLFLYSKKKKDAEYDFVPYKFGCYSYSANADLVTMVKKGFLIENKERYLKNDSIDYLKGIKANDRKLLNEVVAAYGNMTNKSLIIHTYINFPFYATKSTIAKEVLPAKFHKRVMDAVPTDTKKTLFTIGYEGISLEKYLGKLVKHNVKLLIDVRKNPLSMKYGFSKTLLKRYCESLDVEYIHIPHVGIESNQRQELNSQKDYDVLFDEYKSTTLKENVDSQLQILNLLNKHNRVAMTCFESNIHQCHRLHLAESLVKYSNGDFTTEHI